MILVDELRAYPHTLLPFKHWSHMVSDESFEELHAFAERLGIPRHRFQSDHYDLIAPELRTYFRDVHDHILRVNGRVDAFRDLLSSALQANLTQAAVRQNEDMRKISAWVAILAVPTGVAAIYGMNFNHMPELQWTYGYPLVLAVTALLCVMLYWRFRRSGWL